jgi:predicted CopG family antitoxin
MDKPTNCDDKLYEIMKSCWKYDASERISFSEILRKILKREKNVIFLEKFKRKSFYHSIYE